MTRRDFIGNALAALGFSALPGGFLFAVPPGWKPKGKPNLVFGVISDTHLRTVHGKSGRPGHNWPNKYFSAALEYFKSQNVDAVMHCGDFAHRGQVEEMRFHADVWNRIFPGNLAPDGHEVVKLFITGNHDTEGALYGDFVKGNYPDPVERAKHVLMTDMAANWERIWGEKYEPVWHKEVKGYHFFGRNHKVPVEEIDPCLEKYGTLLDGNKYSKRPFFYLQHSRPQGVGAKLLRYRDANPFVFYGHCHWSAASWNIMDVFKGGLPAVQVPSCEPRGCGALVKDTKIAKVKPTRTEQTGKGRQGYVVRLYDEMMVIERREFGYGGSLGSDWVMPLAECKVESVKCKVEGDGRGLLRPHPFSKGELKKVIGEPQFRRGAALEICNCENVKLCNYENMEMKEISQSHNSTISQSHNLTIKIPLADGNPDSRVYAYEVEVKGDGGKALYKAVYAAGVNLGIGHEPDGGVTKLEIPQTELPRGETLVVAVTPLTSLGTRGKPLTAEFVFEQSKSKNGEVRFEGSRRPSGRTRRGASRSTLLDFSSGIAW